MKKLFITLFMIIAVIATSSAIACDLLGAGSGGGKPGDETPPGTQTPPPIENTFDIKSIETYPGYFHYVEYTKGTDEGVTYTCPTGLSIEDGKLIVDSSVHTGVYSITATKGEETEEVIVWVNDTQFLNNKPGDFGTAFIDRLNGTLTSLSNGGYNKDELVLFAGDSFMDERWFFTDFYTRFANQNAHLIGISSSRAEQWIWYGQHLIEYSPKAIVLHVGTNDIFDGNKSANSTTDILIKMFEFYHKYMPETDIYWLTIEPRLGRANENGNSKAVSVNENVIEYASDKDWLIIADTATAFAQDAYEDPSNLGSIKYNANATSYYGDEVHPSCPAGYDKLMEVVYGAGLTISPINQ